MGLTQDGISATIVPGSFSPSPHPLSPGNRNYQAENGTHATDDSLPVYIEEFFLSDAVRSEDKGELQLTTQAATSSNSRSAADGTATGLTVEYGITRRLQFSTELPYGVRSSPTSELPRSWSTVNASLLYQLIRSNRPFALIVGMGADLPVSSRGEIGYEPELLAAKAFGTLQIHTSFVPEFSKGETSLAYNVAAVQPFPHNLRPTLEFNGRRDSGNNSFYITPGLYKHLQRRLEIGAGLPIGIGRYSSPAGLVLKVTWEFGGDDDDAK